MFHVLTKSVPRGVHATLAEIKLAKALVSLKKKEHDKECHGDEENVLEENTKVSGERGAKSGDVRRVGPKAWRQIGDLLEGRNLFAALEVVVATVQLGRQNGIFVEVGRVW